MQTIAETSTARPENVASEAITDINMVRPPGAPTVLALTEVTPARKPWTLTLHPQHLALADAPDTQPYVILREQLMKAATFTAGLQIFSLHKPVRLMFRLSREDAAALANWIGNDVLVRHYLKIRYGWALPLAVIWMFTSLPLSGNPAAGVPAIPFDPIGFGLGVGLLIAWACAKWRPHPVLFLVDSIWFLLYCGQLVVQVMNGRSKGWLILVPLLLWMVLTGLTHFSRFRGTRMR